jgi:hypothetical protein
MANIVRRWKNFLGALPDQESRSQSRAIAAMLEEIAPADICRIYLLPIQQEMWQNPESYNFEDKERLFPSSATKQSPSVPRPS